MSDKRSFIRNFWKERKMVGAMAPSSKYLAKKMLERIDFSTAKVIVELGPGTGVFTRKILQKLSPDGILLVFELNDSFMNMLKKEFKDPRVILIHALSPSGKKKKTSIPGYNGSRALPFSRPCT